MQEMIVYIELKTGYNDNGPAWIAKVRLSKSGRTVYFNNKAFKKKHGCYANFYDIESGEAYWVSNVKKNGLDRHWAGSGKVMLDRKIADEYLVIIGDKSVDSNKFELVDMPWQYPIERIYEIENRKNQ